MPRQTRLILCPINLRHAKVEYNAYSEAVDMARRRGARLPCHGGTGLWPRRAPRAQHGLAVEDAEVRTARLWNTDPKKRRGAFSDHALHGAGTEVLVIMSGPGTVDSV